MGSGDLVIGQLYKCRNGFRLRHSANDKKFITSSSNEIFLFLKIKHFGFIFDLTQNIPVGYSCSFYFLLKQEIYIFFLDWYFTKCGIFDDHNFKITDFFQPIKNDFKTWKSL